VKRTILVVEDELLSRTVIVATLQSYGFNCIAAENGQQALELLTLNPCDLILTDLNMPIVDGLEFIRIVRQREAHIGDKKPIPIVVLSAQRGEMVNATVELGISEYFIKSVSFDKLVAKLQYLLGEIVWEQHRRFH